MSGVLYNLIAPIPEIELVRKNTEKSGNLLTKTIQTPMRIAVTVIIAGSLRISTERMHIISDSAGAARTRITPNSRIADLTLIRILHDSKPDIL